jgi:hypothetical protein
MEIWYSKDLGDAIYGEDKTLHEVLSPYFQQLFLQAGKPPEMAVFTRLESEGRMHCGLVVYFSPAAQQAAKVVGGAPCTKPARPGLDLFAGDPSCWTVLFPESGGVK